MNKNRRNRFVNPWQDGDFPHDFSIYEMRREFWCFADLSVANINFYNVCAFESVVGGMEGEIGG